MWVGHKYVAFNLAQSLVRTAIWKHHDWFQTVYTKSLTFQQTVGPELDDTYISTAVDNYFSIEPGPRLNIKTVFSGIRISIIKKRRSWHSFTFIMSVPILIKRHLYIEKSTILFHKNSNKGHTDCVSQYQSHMHLYIYIRINFKTYMHIHETF